MAWQSYGLDREAQKLVLMVKQQDADALNQSYKMRMAVAYGLERFWGEHLRLQAKEQDRIKSGYWKGTWDALVKIKEQDRIKSWYWKGTWDALVKIAAKAHVEIPNDSVSLKDTKALQAMSEKLWKLDVADQRVALAVLAQLCDCLVWWTQRYKKT
ncbi:MAG TPA: hypothetical protein DCQ32_04235 [Cyanobacteria bacterium UBA8156]|nr:hypothetical protein [Cyanobacteria bacterium UBA8156]